MSAEDAGHSGRERRSGRRRIKRAERLAERIARELSDPAGSSDAEIAKLAGQLRPMLAGLRRSTLREEGKQATLAADGIADLSVAIEKLVESQRAGSPRATLKQLKEGQRALESATAKARKAGDDWSL